MFGLWYVGMACVTYNYSKKKPNITGRIDMWHILYPMVCEFISQPVSGSAWIWNKWTMNNEQELMAREVRIICTWLIFLFLYWIFHNYAKIGSLYKAGEVIIFVAYTSVLCCYFVKFWLASDLELFHDSLSKYRSRWSTFHCSSTYLIWLADSRAQSEVRMT
jgi:hypothetical protein